VLNFNTNDEVLSYVSRNLEPVRGFQVFMRALPAALRRRPNAYQGVLNFNTNDEVLSYVSRNLEPVRGFQVFMRTLPAAPRRRPTLTRAC
jgi:hypothetical protein